MSVFNLDKIFQPKSVAVIGATERKGNIGFAVMSNLINGGYEGEIYPINPNHKTIWGKPTRASILDFEIGPDLAVIAAPVETVPKIIRDCTKTKVGGAVIISAGGKEIGSKGVETEAAIMKEAENSGLRIIGPNCFGIVSGKAKLNASFASHMPIFGKMAFISQSGAICTAILDRSLKEKMGFSYFVSLGSMLDVNFGDVIDYFGADPFVSSIVIFVERLNNIRNFMSAARAVSRVKPIIALKAGRSQAGAKAAASHTGAITGEDAVYDAAFKRAGILRVTTFTELFDCAELLANYNRTSGSGLAIITNAGGLGVMAADALSDYGVEPVLLEAKTIDKLNEVLPPYWSHNNPIDILGDASPERYKKVVEICLSDLNVNGLLIMLAPQALTEPAEVALSLADILKGKPFPVFTVWMGGENMKTGRQIFNHAEIPTFNTPERAVRAFMDLCNYSRSIEMLQQIPSNLPKKLEFDRQKAKTFIADCIEKNHLTLTETESKLLLSFYGIPVNLTEIVQSEDEAIQAAEKIGFPVALKIHSKDISNKTEANGVRLSLKTKDEVKNAFKDVISEAKQFNPEAVIEGATIQTMVSQEGFELILGAKMDQDFGPVIIIGMDGILKEVIKDKAIALPPLNRLLAGRLIEETKIYNLLKGYRNLPPVDLVLLEEILIRIAQLVADFSDIFELDINPFLVSKNNAIAVDARVILKNNLTKSPLHLVISPYPDQYESHALSKDGEKFFIRPIRPEDAPLLVEHFNSLSPQTIYNRFFSPLKVLPHSMLARFTQIDYDREIALVALSEFGNKEKMLGVARVIDEPDHINAEFSIVVADVYQGKGIGAALLWRCLQIAKTRGIEIVYGIVLAENTQMLALGRKLGFDIKKVPGEFEYKLTIDTNKL